MSNLLWEKYFTSYRRFSVKTIKITVLKISTKQFIIFVQLYPSFLPNIVRWAIIGICRLLLLEKSQPKMFNFTIKNISLYLKENNFKFNIIPKLSNFNI